MTVVDSIARRALPRVMQLLAVSFLGVAAPSLAGAQSLVEQLAWAYAISPPPPTPAPPAPADDGKKLTLPGSERSFTRTEAQNRFGPADWFPADHPSMPPVVAIGRQEAGVWACSLCHYPNGRGRPENAGVIGLPKEYFVQQLHDFKNGLRHSAETRKANTELMAGFAHAMTDAEISEAADYFGAMRWAQWIDVVETDTVPKTRLAGGMHLALEGADAGTEPLGRRIVEMPKNSEYTETLRNPHSGFTAYVPKGSVASGKKIVETGGGKTTACAICHGATLDGLAVVPGLRGRSPSYIARQLADLKQGTRHGVWAPLMGPVVAGLNPGDILDVAAYLASLPPSK